ncbi:MAG TPA: glycosyltransferase family 4 protein [Vicinamibacterales bacterium]|jgi:glycosyltransferase involved in cell wall biosynthesis
MRLAWFSPFPPARTGIAGRSAELVAALGARGFTIDVYVDRRAANGPEQVRPAHDFVWEHARSPYDLVVYQFGNSSHHDYIWPYALRYPGLVVLHETCLQHARAALLLRERRPDDYRAEFAWSHPELNPDLAELAVAGLDSALYYEWPMTRALIETSRLVAVHGGAAAILEGATPHTRIRSIHLGEGEPLSPAREAEARHRIRQRYTLPDDEVVFGCFGGLAPEKRVSQILDALAAIAPYAPTARLLLAGATAAHFDVDAEIGRRGLRDRVTRTGYLATDAELTDHLAACDVSLNLRWPTARETSGPWLRAMAAGRPTVITDLTHLGEVPSLDPRTWRTNPVGMRDPERGMRDESAASGIPRTASRVPDPVCIAIDILDEDHSLRLAMRRLAGDADLRARLGGTARAWWRQHHSLEPMVDDYVRTIGEAASLPAPSVELPAHVRPDGTSRLRALVEPFGLADALSRDGLLE